MPYLASGIAIRANLKKKQELLVAKKRRKRKKQNFMSWRNTWAFMRK
jgi:hypothetical protein